MTLTIPLSPETERQLAERAAQRGRSLEGFVAEILEREVTATERPLPEASATVREMLDYRDRVRRTLGGVTVRELREEGRR